jgi:hypothetical protein
MVFVMRLDSLTAHVLLAVRGKSKDGGECKAASKPCLVLFCLCGVEANGEGHEFFEQVAILNEAKHYMSGSVSTHNARKNRRGFHAL